MNEETFMEIQVLLSILNVFTQEAILIDELNNCFNFDHNVFLVHTSADVDRFVRHGSQPKSLFIFKSVSDLESLQEVRSKNTLLIIVPESSSFDKNLDLLKKIRNIDRISTNLKTGVFFQTATSIKDIARQFLVVQTAVCCECICGELHAYQTFVGYFYFPFVQKVSN